MFMTEPRISISIYLIKPLAAPDAAQLFTNAERLTNGLDGRFIGFPAQSVPPRWYNAVQNFLASPGRTAITGQSPAGMIEMVQNSNYFIITFGHAWQKLETGWPFYDFGRRVALETIPPTKIIELNSEQVFAKFHYAKERAPRATSYRAFSVEAERDLVGAVEGMPDDPDFGTIIRGSTSLRMQVPLSTLPRILLKASAMFTKNSYSRKYPTIDNLTEVNDPALRATLDKMLDTELQSGKARKNAVLVAPAFLRGDAAIADGFVFGRNIKNAPIAPYLQYGSWEAHLAGKNQTPSLSTAIGTPIHAFDETHELIESRNVYECLGYEVSHATKPYILSSGIWWSANPKFLLNIDQGLSAYTDYKKLPVWNRSHSENQYNKRCCKGTGRLFFDKNIIHFGGGQSKFEFCDFMDPSNEILFFAKITGRSYDSSHLCEQVKRTAELLFSSDPGFREKLKGSFASTYPRESVTWLNSRPRPGKWRFCVVSLGRDKASLPLFAKCSLSRLAKFLDTAGHPMMFAAV